MRLNDLRYALRSLRRSPLFTLVTILTLGIGIGATTAIFAVVHGVLLRPLPYPEPERIVSVQTHFVSEGRQIPRVAGGDWEDIRKHGAFESIASYWGGELGVQLGERAEFHRVVFVSPRFFQVFGVAPVSGRTFQEADAKQSAVVSTGFAETQFGGVSNALGKFLSVDANRYEVVGVMPAGFGFPDRGEIWLAAEERAIAMSRTAYNHRPVARLAPTLSREAANAQLAALAQDLAGKHPDTNAKKSFVAVPLKDQIVSGSEWTLFLLLGSVGLMMLIACINVASLFLARAMGRVREIAIRGAMGASRWRVLRQLLAECLVLAGAACLVGIWVAYAADQLVAWIPAGFQRIHEVSVDPVVMLFAVSLAVGSILLFGLAPAWQASRPDLREGLLQGGGRGVLGGRAGWLRNGLVATEIALAVVLLLGAGLLFRTMLALNATDMGLQTDGVLVMVAHEPASTEVEYRRVAREIAGLGTELEALPGVRSAGIVVGLPTGQYGSNGYYAVDGIHHWGTADKLPHALFALASPGYFRTVGIRLIQGRDFQPGDLIDAHFVAIVSESLARQTFGEESPIGRHIRCGLDDPRLMEIVGVVSDVRQTSPSDPQEPLLYMALAQHPYYANEVQAVMRTDGDPAALVPTVRRFMQERNPAVSTKFTTMPEMVAQSVALPRFRWMLGVVFATISLLLALAGIYGLMAFVARQRLGEMGLRMAIGANPADVWRLFFSGAAKLGVVGLAAGLLLSLLAGRVLEQMLYGVEALDMATYLSVIMLVGAAVLGAVALPAWRAARVDPITVLREE